MAGRTVCIDDQGRQVAVYPDLMKQVQVGADFYVGQELYHVVSLKPEDGQLIIELKKAKQAP